MIFEEDKAFVRALLGDDVVNEAEENAVLIHYGVQGMKWGIRKKYESTGNPVGRPKGNGTSSQLSKSEMRANARAKKKAAKARAKAKKKALKRKRLAKAGIILGATAAAAIGASIAINKIKKRNEALQIAFLKDQEGKKAEEALIKFKNQPGIDMKSKFVEDAYNQVKRDYNANIKQIEMNQKVRNALAKEIGLKNDFKTGRQLKKYYQNYGRAMSTMSGNVSGYAAWKRNFREKTGVRL